MIEMRSGRTGGARRVAALACALAIGFVAALAAGPAAAVDVPTMNPPLEDRAMREARAAIAERQWARALSLLEGHVQQAGGDADAHNLLGYSLRHLGRYAESRLAYEQALAIDPAHLGAHEYLGELFLQTGRRDLALRQLKILADLCKAECEEYLELAQAIAEDRE